MRKHLRLFLGFFALVLATSFAKAQWSEIPSLPNELDWTMTAQLGGKIYAFGGYGYNSVYTYTPGAAQWEKLSVGMPKPKFGGYAAAVNGKIYIVGGFILNSAGSIVTNADTYEFDPATNTFTTKAAIPTKTGFFAGAEVNGMIYVIGGSTSTANTATDFTTIQIYDPAANTWSTSGTETPYTGRFAASATMGGKIYVMGGSNAGAYVNQLWRGTISGTDITWEKLANLPAALTRGSAGSVNGKIVFSGGAPTPTSGFSNTYVYDEPTNKWSTSYALPVATYNSGQLFGVGSDLYMASGYGTNRAFKYTQTDVLAPLAFYSKTSDLVNLKEGQMATVLFPMTNLGVQPLNLTITVPDNAKSWIIPQAATVAVGVRSTKDVSFDLLSGSMAPGLYTADVTAATNDPASPTITYHIVLYVLSSGTTAQATKVVVEEGTGDWCGYCPDGHRVLGELEDTFGDNVIILSYHGPSGEPFQIADGQAILDGLNIQGYPNAAINRWLFSGEAVQMTNRGSWPDYVQQVLDNAPQAGADINVISQSFDESTNKVKATIEVTTKQASLVGNMHLTTVVTEDGIHYRQVNYGPEGDYDDYIHDDVVRAVYPDHFGLPLDFSAENIQEGVVKPEAKITKTIEFDINDDITNANWNVQDPKNCHITYFVNGVSGSALTSILQGVKMPLVQSSVKVSDVANAVTASNYPNPVAKATTFTYTVSTPSVVNLAVYDVMGREVARLVTNESHTTGTYEALLNAEKLSNGTYTYVLAAGMQKVTGTMIVQK